MPAFIRHVPVPAGTNRQIHRGSLRRRVLLSQLPLVAAVAMVTAAAALFHPGRLANPVFAGGLVLLALLTAACAAVPWHRLPYGSFWVIPILDFAVVGLVRHGAADALAGLYLLAVFPVFWLAWSGVCAVAACLISLAAAAAVVWVPVIAAAGPVEPADLATPVAVPIVMLALAVSAALVSGNLTARNRALAARDRELQRLLAESKKRSRLLDTVLDTVGVGVVAVDAGGREILMNSQQRMYHRLAVPAGAADPGESGLLAFEADRKTPIAARERPVSRAVRGESFSDRLIWLGPGERQRAVSVTARAMTDDDGRFDGSVITFTDVTDLVTALAVKEEFVASVSHELRTPLTSIMGHLDLVLEEESGLPRDAAAALRIALRNSERLLQLVTDLLSTATGNYSVRLRPACLAQVLRASVASAGPKAEASGVRLHLEAPQTLPALIDPERMGQVADNLLSNAIKYSPAGGDVSVRAWADSGGAAFRLEDHGIGIAKADHRKVFTRFFRTGNVRQAAIPGVGLGLAITKSIVDAHGGRITFESEPGAGTTFTVCLPPADTVQVPAEAAPASRPRAHAR
ncbi:sensor histidine kinase [Arthrobacter sp. GCM10027362]|uniref:sensor histidine kinase n=1 Tax=Arthrobacter sp. GCM10027362 TaxID=3273379 RepID=UPI003637003C